MATIPSPRPEPLRAPWVPGAGAAAMMALAAFAFGDRIEKVTHIEASGAVLLALLLLAGVTLTLRPRDRPAETCALALGFVPAALPLWLATVWAECRSYTVDRSIETLWLWFGFVCIIPALVAVMVGVGRLLGRRFVAPANARVAIVVRAAAWLAVAGAATSLGLWHERTRLPAAKAYLDSLPIVASFEESDRTLGPGSIEPGGGELVRRKLGQGICVIAAADGASPVDLWGFRACGPMIVRADRARGLLVLEGPYGAGVAIDRTRGWRLTRLAPLHFAGSVRPPDAFAPLALIGLVLGLAALLWPRPSTWLGLPADESACRDAEALADGTLRFGDGTPPLPHGSPGLLGPVVAVLGAPAESFRDHAGPKVLRVVPGTIAEHRFAARVGPAAFALAFLVIASAPLATALVYLR